MVNTKNTGSIWVLTRLLQVSVGSVQIFCDLGGRSPRFDLERTNRLSAPSRLRLAVQMHRKSKDGSLTRTDELGLMSDILKEEERLFQVESKGVEAQLTRLSLIVKIPPDLLARIYTEIHVSEFRVGVVFSSSVSSASSTSSFFFFFFFIRAFIQLRISISSDRTTSQAGPCATSSFSPLPVAAQAGSFLTKAIQPQKTPSTQQCPSNWLPLAPFPSPAASVWGQQWS